MSTPLPVDRRRFLKVLGVTGAGAAAVSACGIGPEPTEHLIPYLIQPEDQIPGTATYYATTCRECAAGCGMRVRVREGRAVKRSEEHTSELQSRLHLVCRLLLEKKKK